MAVAVAVAVIVAVTVAIVVRWRSDGCYEMVSRCRRIPIYESRNNRQLTPYPSPSAPHPLQNKRKFFEWIAK